MTQQQKNVSYDFQREMNRFSDPAEMHQTPSEPEENSGRSQSFWEQLFHEMNFLGMDLMAVPFFNLSQDDLIEQRTLFQKTIRDFLKLLGYSYANDLRAAGVSEDGIFYIKKGILPENYTVHLKYPLEYGGRISFDNMVFMQTHPYHDLIHAYVDQQLLTDKGSERPSQLFVPTPTTKIYIPLVDFTGSGGKNKQDRSSLAGFTQSALKEIMIKSMPGR